jgi:glutathione S-transferase
MADFGQIVLHSYRWCPNAIRVGIVLALKKIAHAAVEEKLGDWTDFLNQNVPSPKVPVLVHDGRIIRESNDINEYLETICPEPELIPFRRTDADRMRDWWHWCENDLKPGLDQYKHSGEDEIRFEGKSELERQLEHLEKGLQGKHFLLGEQITLADIAVIPFIRQIQRVRRDPVNFRHFPRVKIWADQILGKPFFEKDVMKQYPFAKDFPTVDTSIKY